MANPEWDNYDPLSPASLAQAPEVAKREAAEKSARKAWECEVSLKEKHHALRKMLGAAEAERDQLRGALNTLVERCTDYRAAHDIQGDGSHEAGYAWDQMRKAEQAARAALEAK